jgi:hypothetical protein
VARRALLIRHVDVNWVKRDSDFAPLHDLTRYRDLIGRAEARLAEHRSNVPG